MKIILSILLALCVTSVFSANEKLFCHGDGVRSTLFYFDGKITHEFVDIQFNGPKYLENYLACTNFLFSLTNKDRSRKINYVSLLNTIKKPLIRFSGADKKLYYDLCQMNQNCEIKFPYSLLEPAIFFRQITQKQEPLECDDIHPIKPPYPIQISDQIKEIQFWELPKEDLISQFWKVAKSGNHEKIILSSMTFSLTFLDQLMKRFKDTETQIYLLTSFNIMAMDDRILKNLAALPPNFHFIPIYQSSKEPYSHHQKGAIFFSKTGPTVIWNSSNFRKYESQKLFDLGITFSDKELSEVLFNRWMLTAQTSCSEIKYRNCSLNLRYSSSPQGLALWESVTKKGCAQLPAMTETTPNKPTALELVLSLIKGAQKSILVHSHVIGHSLILDQLKLAHQRGIDVKMIGGKPTKAFKIPWLKIIFDKREHHAKFMIVDDTTFLWGTGNITKTSFDNQREDFFYGNNIEIISKLKHYFETSWKAAK